MQKGYFQKKKLNILRKYQESDRMENKEFLENLKINDDEKIKKLLEAFKND